MQEIIILNLVHSIQIMINLIKELIKKLTLKIINQ